MQRHSAALGALAGAGASFSGGSTLFSSTSGKYESTTEQGGSSW